ncbi:MAG: glycoside hydrolase family 97 protein [Colwelliaceae bacterium]|nr:glycoside hydrolase family 97 protein [Colwelliaceae bacterium]
MKFIHLKVFIFLVLTSLLLIKSTNAESYKIDSPNGKLKLELVFDKKLLYSLKVNDDSVFKNSEASLVIKHNDKGSIPKHIVSVKRNNVNRILFPHVKQKSKKIAEHYNEITLMFDNKQSISFRLFDQGMAYRFSTKLIGKVVVKSEHAQFNFDHDHKVLFPEEKSFISHNERLYLPMQLREIKSNQFASLPLLIDTTATKVVITETGLRDYPGMWLKGDNNEYLQAIFPKQVLKSELKKGSDRNEDIIKRASYLSKNIITKEEGGRNFPWRVFATSQNDAELLTNQLSYLLADELAINPTWIKPGQVAWDWWNANNIYGVDFEAGINTQTYKYYIDFAAKYGIEYIVLDEGWHHLDNVLNVVKDINVQEIIDYGKSKNVDVILWVIWKTLDEQLEHALDEFQKWGAAGIKVDFMQRDDQAMVNYYWRIAKQAAKRHLLVDFHGSYKPAGLRRTYPNVITREGVRGLEHNKWADYITAEHNLTLPFIRQLAGPMDYTPGAMVNAQPKNFKIVFDRPMSKTTRVHQMAMYVVFESPLQMLADTPSNYLKEQESTEFISKVPTVWDETIILSAKLSDHIITARKSGEDWFIGVMGNSKKRDFAIDLSFLGEGEYLMENFADGINADKYASDYQIQKRVVSANTKVNIQLAPSGGWVARLKNKI